MPAIKSLPFGLKTRYLNFQFAFPLLTPLSLLITCSTRDQSSLSSKKKRESLGQYLLPSSFYLFLNKDGHLVFASPPFAPSTLIQQAAVGLEEASKPLRHDFCEHQLPVQILLKLGFSSGCPGRRHWNRCCQNSGNQGFLVLVSSLSLRK